MEKLILSSCLCFFCILKPCYVLDSPSIEGELAGQILEFNCSTSHKPFGQTVEIVANEKSLFTLAHFNTTCFQKNVACKPDKCSCTSNWFQWEMEIQNPTIILKVQCLMRYPENKREIVNATIAFNGSYFWDYSAKQTVQTVEINFASTTKVALNTIDNSTTVYIAVGAVSAFIFIIIMIFIAWLYRRRGRKRRNLESPLVRVENWASGVGLADRRRNRSSSFEMQIRERISDHSESTDSKEE
ncbi:unnamed protein product [Mytilus coruscus]|uniref:Uncharacterized protein n=1 Tax=Mytilus coruscus TaxID=42192 RepID=A0A6J7ZTH2_MYTCO|nr:unnamed protein product [Mytilus coruscus]